MFTDSITWPASKLLPREGKKGVARALLVFMLAGALSACGGGSAGSGSGSSGASSGGNGGSGAALITVDPGVRHQTISGWEVAANVDDYTGEISKADAVLYDETAVNQVGITRLRLVVRPSYEGQIGAYDAYSSSKGTDPNWHNVWYTPINDDADPNHINWAGFDFAELDHQVDYVVLPVRDALVNNGDKLFLDVVYVVRSLNTPNIHEDPAEYAEFALATMLHLRQKYGLNPDTWEVINEPEVAKRWDGARIGNSIVATARRFDQNNISAKFVAPSTESMANAATYFDGTTTVPGAVARMSELSYHRYKGVSQAALDALKTRAQNYGLDLSMLEYWFGNATPDVLFEDLGAGAVAFEGRNLRGEFNGNPGGPLTLRDDVRLNSLVYRNVRPGAVRVDATAQSGPFKSLAFLRTDSKLVAALRATSAGTVTVRGLSSGQYTIAKETTSGSVAPAAVTRAANGDITVSTNEAGVFILAPQ